MRPPTEIGASVTASTPNFSLNRSCRWRFHIDRGVFRISLRLHARSVQSRYTDCSEIQQYSVDAPDFHFDRGVSGWADRQHQSHMVACSNWYRIPVHIDRGVYSAVNRLGVKWFERPAVSRHHETASPFRTTPRHSACSACRQEATWTGYRCDSSCARTTESISSVETTSSRESSRSVSRIVSGRSPNWNSRNIPELGP